MIYKLVNRADGVDGHYCVGRSEDGVYFDFWNECGEWCSAGTVYIGKQTAQEILDAVDRTKRHIPQEWIKQYVDKLLEVVKEMDPDSAMHQALLVRATHALDLVEAFREDSK